MSTVIRMCGMDGRAAPTCRTSTPWLKRGPDSSSALTNWEDDEASISTRAALQRAAAVHGQRERAAAVVVDAGAEHAQRVDHAVQGALVGTGVAVEADRAVGEGGHRGQEAHDRAGVADVDRGRAVQPGGDDPPRLAGGAPRSPAPAELEETVSSMPTPIARSASAISRVSRERSGRRSQPGSAASAASTRPRLVTDFEPGTVTVASTAPLACGAGQRAGCAGLSVMPSL